MIVLILNDELEEYNEPIAVLEADIDSVKLMQLKHEFLRDHRGAMLYKRAFAEWLVNEKGFSTVAYEEI